MAVGRSGLRIAGREEFYRIELDPRETNDLIVNGMTAGEEARLVALREELEQLLAS